MLQRDTFTATIGFAERLGLRRLAAALRMGKLASRGGTMNRIPSGEDSAPTTEQAPPTTAMSATKTAIPMDGTLLHRLERLVKARSFRSRSHAVREVVAEKISRMDKTAHW